MHFDESQKKKIFMAILGGCAAVLVIIAAVLVSLGSGSEGITYSGIPVPDNELLVNDIYDGEVLIPKFDLPAAKWDYSDLKKKEDIIVYENANAQLGVDVSSYQGDIDWAEVKKSGVDFAIVRVGYRGMTQGLLNEDDRFEQNIEGAKAAGLKVGVYFFSQAITEAEARAEAKFAIDKLKGRKLDYPVVFDWEQPVATAEMPADTLRAYSVSGDKAASCGAAFCEEIKAAGYIPCVYTNKYQAYRFFNLDRFADVDLWYAEYHDAPSLYYDFRIWQYTNDGRIKGIDGGVDVNICFKAY